MSDPYIGQITLFAGTFAPKNWALCNGQLLSISQNAALFSILGTTYGGNGTQTFGLPDLRGRVAVSAGQGPGLSNYVLGQLSGSENVTLTTQQMPQHNHIINANNNTNNSIQSPSQAFLSETNDIGKSYKTYASSLGNPSTLNPNSVQFAGNSQGHPNLQPLLVLNYIIAVQGLFPSRD